MPCNDEMTHLTLSWRRPLSYRNQSIYLLCKSMDWFLYDNGLRHERVKYVIALHFLLGFFGGIPRAELINKYIYKKYWYSLQPCQSYKPCENRYCLIFFVHLLLLGSITTYWSQNPISKAVFEILYGSAITLLALKVHSETVFGLA